LRPGRRGDIPPTMPHASPALPIAVVGAGPAGLMAAEVLAQAGRRVVIFEKMPSVGRKVLMAGRGGLNLTHSEPMEPFLARYGPAQAWLAPRLAAFPPAALVAWAESLGQPTFVGSSGRVFPKAFKASPLLRAWLARLESLGVEFRPRWRWTGWEDDSRLRFETPDGARSEGCAAVVLALGGASWPRLGSDGAWTAPLAAAGVRLAPFSPANSGVEIAWSRAFADRFAGAPLKAVALGTAGRMVRGEAMVTRYGLEGGTIYALGREIRQAMSQGGPARLTLDLRPAMRPEDLAQRLDRDRGGQSTSTFLRKAAHLSPLESAILREAHGERLSREPAGLAGQIKAVALQVTGVQGLERAISSAGGVALAELDARMMLRAHPGTFLAGEMLDWEAPTGGYLLQACFATGVAAANGVLDWLAA
jgi:uncharacterized flavoprotein (TIGR03862 family)